MTKREKARCLFNDAAIAASYHYFSAKGHDIKHDRIKVFGSVDSQSNYRSLILGEHSHLARTSHLAYAGSKLALSGLPEHELVARLEQHDRNESNSSLWLAWLNLPIFKRRSNFTEQHSRTLKL